MILFAISKYAHMKLCGCDGTFIVVYNLYVIDNRFWNYTKDIKGGIFTREGSGQ